MLVLPDVNVLVALAWPTHVHHELVHAWIARHSGEPWATCPLTQSGFVRVSSNRQVIPAAKSPREAIQALDAMIGRPGHVFLADEVSIADAAMYEAKRARRCVSNASSPVARGGGRE